MSKRCFLGLGVLTACKRKRKSWTAVGWELGRRTSLARSPSRPPSLSLSLALSLCRSPRALLVDGCLLLVCAPWEQAAASQREGGGRGASSRQEHAAFWRDFVICKWLWLGGGWVCVCVVDSQMWVAAQRRDGRRGIAASFFCQSLFGFMRS